MNAHPLAARLAVCSWSLQSDTPQQLGALVTSTGVKRVQHDPAPLSDAPTLWGGTQARLAEAVVA